MRISDWSSDVCSSDLVLTLHDEWAYTGHCAYTLGCERWRSGCGQCPHLDVYPSIRRDASAANWTAKYDIYSSSRLYVATPSHWLMRSEERRAGKECVSTWRSRCSP